MVNIDDVSGNASNLAIYDFAGGKKLVEAVFTVNGTGTTNVDLNVVDLTLGKLNPATGTVDADSEYEAVVNGDMANDLFDHINSDAKVEAYVEPTTTEPTTVEPTTVEPTEVPTTVEPTTVEPTTVEPTTVEPTEAPTTVEPTTVEPTEAPTTVEPTTVVPETTVEPMPSDATQVPAAPRYLYAEGYRYATFFNADKVQIGDVVAGELYTSNDINSLSADNGVGGPDIYRFAIPNDAKYVSFNNNASDTTEQFVVVVNKVYRVTPTTPDATSATQPATKGQSTADTATSDTPANGTSSNAVQTGNASMAVVILLALVSATGVVYFTRKRFNK